MPTEYVEDGHHLLRHVKWALVRRDENGNVLGLNPQSFMLRDGEDYLSASWLEYFADAADPVQAAIKNFGEVLRVKPKDRYAKGNVAAIKAACSEHGQRVRVTREPRPGFEAHSGVRQFRNDNDELFELLAAQAWAELFVLAPT